MFYSAYYIDDVYVIEPDLPQPELPADTSLCAGDSLLLGSGLPGSPYLNWPDGSHDSTFMARGPGTYWVRYDSADHHSWDSIVIAEKKIQFELPFTDTTLCPGSSFVLQLPEVPGRTYHWPDGMAGNSYKIDTSGTVQVMAREGNCTATRELKVSYHNRRQRYELPADTLLCRGESLRLKVSPAYGELQWPDGSRENSYSIKKSGEYTLQIENECDRYSTTIRVEEEVCDCHLYLPNAITIDGNELNDTFKVTAECLLPDFRMRIYNRWGELLFESTNPAIGWAGVNGAKQEGIYLYTISATASNGERLYRSGTVTVVY